MSLSPGPNTFTRESLRKVWHKFPVRPSRYKYFQRYRQQYGQGKSELVEIACLELYESISQEPAEHLDRLDEAFEPFYLDPFPSWSTRLPEDEVSLSQRPITIETLPELRFFVKRLTRFCQLGHRSCSPFAHPAATLCSKHFNPRLNSRSE